MIFGIGTPLEVLTAIVVYMVATVLVTEAIKKFTKSTGNEALLLSWLVGIGLFAGLAMAKLFPFNFATVILFMFVTGMTNKIYRWEALREFIRKMLKMDL